MYQRTPTWIVRKINFAIPGWVKWLLWLCPPVQWLFRGIATIVTEIAFVFSVVYNKQFPALAKLGERAGVKNIRSCVKDPALQEKLIPKYPFGCKRPTMSNQFYRAFNRKNVTLCTAPISHFSPDGIVVTEDEGERKGQQVENKIDALVLATGFSVIEKGNMPTFELIGTDGIDLNAYWDEFRYHAYEGVTVPSFPNMFIMFGPFSFTGASWFTILEAHATHILRVIEETTKRRSTKCEIKKEKSLDFLNEMTERMKDTLFVNQGEGCSIARSYYFDKHGDASLIRPSSGFELHYRCKYFPIDDYEFSSLPPHAASTAPPPLVGKL